MEIKENDVYLSYGGTRARTMGNEMYHHVDQVGNLYQVTKLVSDFGWN